MTPIARHLAAALACLAVCLSAAVANACSVPVFRYALERWPSCPYEVTVTHREPLTDEEKALVDRLRELSVEAGEPNGLLRLAVAPTGETGARPPQIALRYPEAIGVQGVVWRGPLTAANIDKLLGSPARVELARRLVGGQSGVFVLLACGDADKDATARRTLRGEINRLEKTLELPKPPPGEWDDLIYDTEGPPEDLRIEFSVLTVDRDDPAEEVFGAMLLEAEANLYADEPVVFPVFGRALAHWALVGRGINRENIDAAARLLVGPCSCIVREDYRGVDLMIDMDWDAALAGSPSSVPTFEPSVQGTSAFAETTDAESGESLGPVGRAAIAAAGGAVLATAAGLVIWTRGRKPTA